MRKFAHKVMSLPDTMASPGETCYRNKAQYPIRPGKDGKATFGYFAKTPIGSSLASAACWYLKCLIRLQSSPYFL